MLPIHQYFFSMPLKKLAEKVDSPTPKFCGKNCTTKKKYSDKKVSYSIY